jgi:selenocysteine-specific elongation factor
LDEHERAALTLLDEIAVESGRARPRGQATPLPIIPMWPRSKRRCWHPPDPVGVDRGELRELVKSGRVVEVDGVFFAAAAFDRAAELCAQLLRAHADGFTVADFRDAAHNSRKHALPILNRLDATGVLRRRGDLRIAGPRSRSRSEGRSGPVGTGYFVSKPRRSSSLSPPQMPCGSRMRSA